MIVFQVKIDRKGRFRNKFVKRQNIGFGSSKYGVGIKYVVHNYTRGVV